MTVAAGTPFDSLFAALTERMGILHTASPDTAPSTDARVEWRRGGGPEPEPCPYQLDGVVVIGRLAHPWLAQIYGASDLEVSLSLSQLWGHVDLLVGPAQGIDDVRTGYKLAPGKIEPRGGDGTAAGWGCDVRVTLYTIVTSQILSSTPGTYQLAATPGAPTALAGTPFSTP